jgi:hypothetical protein
MVLLIGNMVLLLGNIVLLIGSTVLLPVRNCDLLCRATAIRPLYG